MDKILESYKKTDKKKDFQYSTEPEPHKKRTKDILSAHPEVRNSMGRNPSSFLIILFLVITQFLIAFLLRESPWWYTLVGAVLIGAFCNHALYVLVHDATHNLIFKTRAMNKWAAIIADLVNIAPAAISFRTFHLKHHSFQGDYGLDADIPSRWEAKVVGNFFLFKALWLFLFPILQAIRPTRTKEINLFSDKWTFVNWFLVFGVDVLVIYFMGWTSFLYMFSSFFLSIGLHPLGARWIQEHYLIHPPQETYSYYGVLNVPALNVGYHNEHHDFPSVPWNKLPEIRAKAPEFYNTLYYHKSWVKLLFKFIFDPNITLYTRMVRTNRGGLQVKPE